MPALNSSVDQIRAAELQCIVEDVLVGFLRR